MTYSLRITQEASEQLVSLQRYISAQATPEIAENYIAEILAHCEGLTVFPRRGPARAADQRRVCVANAGLREAAGMASAAGRTCGARPSGVRFSVQEGAT